MLWLVRERHGLREAWCTIAAGASSASRDAVDIAEG
jgi:hypothetical protein